MPTEFVYLRNKEKCGGDDFNSFRSILHKYQQERTHVQYLHSKAISAKGQNIAANKRLTLWTRKILPIRDLLFV